MIRGMEGVVVKGLASSGGRGTVAFQFPTGGHRGPRFRRAAADDAPRIGAGRRRTLSDDHHKTRANYGKHLPGILPAHLGYDSAGKPLAALLTGAEQASRVSFIKLHSACS